MKNRLIAIALLLVAQVANADGIYHCTRNGNRVITDQPCEIVGAKYDQSVGPQRLPLRKPEPNLPVQQFRSGLEQKQRALEEARRLNNQPSGPQGLPRFKAEPPPRREAQIFSEELKREQPELEKARRSRNR